MQKTLKQGSVLGSLSIVCFLGLLYVSPTALKRRSHVFAPPLTHTNAQISMAHPLIRFSPSHPDLPNSHRLTLSDITKDRNSLYIINFWATWCPPCIDELPSLEYLYRLFHHQGTAPSARLLTISVDDKDSDIDQLLTTLSFRPTFPILRDHDAKLASSLGSTKFPETYLINAKGDILHKWIGPQNWASEAVIREIKRFSTTTR